MLAALVVTVVVLACGALLALRVKVRAKVKAMADAQGSWRAAAGGAVGPIAFTAGVSPDGAAWTAHVLGRSVARGTRVPEAARARLTPMGAFSVARRALRRVRFDRVDARVHGAAGDPATSAQVLGLIMAAGPVLAPRATIASDVDWMAEAPFVDVDCDVEASFVPVAIGWDFVRDRLASRKHRALRAG
ncbi:MAG TPA: hypothetical protein VGL81_31415 [Polyangiaceae bacterium]